MRINDFYHYRRFGYKHLVKCVVRLDRQVRLHSQLAGKLNQFDAVKEKPSPDASWENSGVQL